MKKTVAIYFLIIALDSISFGLIAPIIAPLLTQARAFFAPFPSSVLAYIFYGLLLSSFHLAFMFGAPLFGTLSDLFGRKKILLCCLFLTLIAFVMYILSFAANNFSLLVLARILSGLSAGSQCIAQAAIISYSVQNKKPSIISFIAIGMTLGLIVGPLLASLWSYTTTWVPFGIVMLLTTFNIFILILFLEEKNNLLDKKTKSINIKYLFKIPFIFHLLGTFFLFELGWSLYYQATPLWISLQWNIKNPQLGLIHSYIGIALTISLFFMARIGLKLTALTQLISGGFLLGIIALLFIFIQPRFFIFLLTTLPIVVTIALVYPGLVVHISEIFTNEQQGLIMGITNALLALAFSITGILSSALIYWNPSSPFLVAAIFWGTATMIYIKFSRKITCSSVLT